MQAEIQLTLESGRVGKYKFNHVPDKCPICNTGIKPDIHFGYYSDIHPTHFNIYDVQVVFQCPLIDCQALFIGYYKFTGSSNNLFILYKIAPLEPRDIVFKDIIKNISSSFTEIYNQAQKAEQMGWLQVAGPGYRKSLEFLIKDYCSGKTDSVEDIENIRREFIGRVIEKHIDEPRIKKMANRAAWLGNDETHYVRKWENKDLDDLKTLIVLTLNWIEIVELSNQYTEEMPEAKK